MAQCTCTPTNRDKSLGYTCSETAGQRTCKRVQCERWLLPYDHPLPEALPAVMPLTRSYLGIRHPDTRQAAQSSGVIINGGVTGSNWTLTADLVVSNNSWVEVIRTNQVNLLPWVQEGVQFYGCWFFIAPGSGIWVNTKRTIWARSRGEALDALVPRWLESHGMSPRGYKLADRRGYGVALTSRGATGLVPRGVLAVHPRKEHFPFFANKLGYHSVQVRVESYLELIVTSDTCMRGKSPLSTCVSSQMEVFAGWVATQTCCCLDGIETNRSKMGQAAYSDQSSFLLNCDC